MSTAIMAECIEEAVYFLVGYGYRQSYPKNPREAFHLVFIERGVAKLDPGAAIIASALYAERMRRE